MISPSTIEQVVNVKPAISMDMMNAIDLWGKMYEDRSPWLHRPDDENPALIDSLGLPQLIASEKARTALIEFKSEITVPVEQEEVNNPDYVQPTTPEELVSNIPRTLIQEKPVSSDVRANFLNTQYEKLKKHLRRQIEYGIAKGGLVVKPYVLQDKPDDQGISYKFEFDFVQADGFFPLAFDGGGVMTEAAFVQRKIDKDTVYSRVEHHKYENGKVTIKNKAFKTNNANIKNHNNDNGLGKEIELSEVPEWAALEPEVIINDVDRLMFAYFKMPEANTIDTYSTLGVSGYSRAVKLIEQADKQYSRLLWEYEGGELAIDIDRDAVRPENRPDGSTVSKLPIGQQRLFRYVDISQTGETYNPYAPALRDASYIQGLNTILMRIEDVTGLSRGTLSDASAEARTATELKILKQRSYQTNAHIQESIQDMLDDVIYIMNVYCEIYGITEAGEYEVSYEWDDSILVDVDAELGKRITLMQNGIDSKLEVREWYHGETENQAREALAKVNEESQQAMEQNLAGQMMMGQISDRMEQ